MTTASKLTAVMAKLMMSGRPQGGTHTLADLAAGMGLPIMFAAVTLSTPASAPAAVSAGPMSVPVSVPGPVFFTVPLPVSVPISVSPVFVFTAPAAAVVPITAYMPITLPAAFPFL